jgi:hypothetical protein
MSLLNIVGNVVGGFSDDHQIGRHRLESFRVCRELFERRVSYERLNFGDGIKDIWIRCCQILDDIHGLGEDPVAETRLQTPRRPKVDPAAEEILETALELHEPEQPDGSVKLH